MPSPSPPLKGLILQLPGFRVGLENPALKRYGNAVKLYAYDKLHYHYPNYTLGICKLNVHLIGN